MKRKQIMALLLSSTLSLGVISPVMAADSLETMNNSENSATVETIDEGKVTQANPEKQDSDKKNTENAVAAETTTSEKPANPVPSKAPVQKNEDEADLLKDTMIKTMSDSLTALIKNSVENYYNGMSDAAKKQFFEDSGITDDAAFRKFLKENLYDKVTVSALQNVVTTARFPDKALTDLEAVIVGAVDELYQVMDYANSYVTSSQASTPEYLLKNLSNAARSLSSILHMTPELYKMDYLKDMARHLNQVKSYIAQIETPGFKVTTDYWNEIIKYTDSVARDISTSDNHLDTYILTDVDKAIKAFPALYALIPQSLIEEKAFDGATDSGMVGNIYYKDLSEYVKKIAVAKQEVSQHLSYENLSTFNAYYYGNIVSAYQKIAQAIVSEAKDSANKLEAIGYNGSEKAAYEAALAKLEVLANHVKDPTVTYGREGFDYASYASLAKDLNTKLDAYAKAANKFLIEEGEKKISEAKTKLEAIKLDVEAHKDFYVETYAKEVNDVLSELASAKVDENLPTLLAKANEVIAKQKDSYSEFFWDGLKSATTYVQQANKWWSYLSDKQKQEAVYTDAIAITDALSQALVTENGIYNLDILLDAAKTFSLSWLEKDGEVYLAAKSVLESLIADSEKIYQEESKKEHTAGTLDAYAKSLETLKTFLPNFDIANTASIQSAADALLAARDTVVNDRPQTNVPNTPAPNKADPATQNKPNTTKKTVAKNTVHTGDTENTATPGLFGLISLAGIASVLGFKRKK